jgi:16S rRNA (guanine(966)-N(2))-methyltransferase RsmD
MNKKQGVSKSSARKSTMRVIAGSFKGMGIPFDHLGFNNSQTSSQRLKEAFFSMTGTNLRGLNFLDMFACSGQIGIEAYSRCANTLCFEFDKDKYDNLRGIISGLKTKPDPDAGSIQVVNCDSFKHIKAGKIREKFDIVFIDPPYSQIIEGLISSIYALKIIQNSLNSEAMVAVQHNFRLDMPLKVDSLTLTKQRKYGKSGLSIYYNESVY